MANFDYRKFLKENKSTFHASLNEGQFSWFTQDTEEQIGSEPQNTITVYMHDDEGNTWKEDNYGGYGEFGGMDYYELLDKMNGGEGDRSEGIRLAFDDAAVAAGKVLFPALTQDSRYPKGHDFTQEAKHDPDQSWYAGEEDDDDDSWETQYDEDGDEILFEAQGDKFDVETTRKIAQKVADAFTADDDLDLKYVVSPDVEESSFDLDVEAGPNTPGEDWKDVNGFDISNYLGKYAGGSFYIKDGVVVNAASRNAKVANVSPEGEVEMISAEDSRADLDAREKANVFVREENKSNKMKKSELKEMIKAAMLAEYEKDVDYTDENPESEEDFLAETQNSEVLAMVELIMNALGPERFIDELISAMDTSEAKANLEHIIQMWDLDGGLYEAEGDEEVDAEETTDVAVDDTETIDTETTSEINPEAKVVQDTLTQAMEAAKKLGDKKLESQIGNTITFFTRQHIAGTEIAEEMEVEENTKEYYKDAEADDAEHIKALEKDMADDKEDSMKIGEVMFPMWTKLKK